MAHRSSHFLHWWRQAPCPALPNPISVQHPPKSGSFRVYETIFCHLWEDRYELFSYDFSALKIKLRNYNENWSWGQHPKCQKKNLELVYTLALIPLLLAFFASALCSSSISSSSRFLRDDFDLRLFFFSSSSLNYFVKKYQTFLINSNLSLSSFLSFFFLLAAFFFFFKSSSSLDISRVSVFVSNLIFLSENEMFNL